MTMEPNTSAGNANTEHEVDHDVDDLTNTLAALQTNDEDLITDAIIVIYNLNATSQNHSTTDLTQIVAWCSGYPEFRVAISSTTTITEALNMFLDFLTGLNGKSLLATHGGSKFHQHVIVRLMRVNNLLERFQSLVLGFIDTQYVFKAKFEDLGIEMQSMKLKDLAKEYNISGQIDATEKVTILVSLIEAIGVTDEDMKRHVEELNKFIGYIDLIPVFGDYLSKPTLKKFANDGHTLSELQTANENDPVDGLKTVLKK